MKLETIRRRIDAIDRELLGLLEERFDLALRTRRLKPAVADAAREEDVLARARHTPLGLIEAGFAQRIFGAIIEEARGLQERVPTLVAFQGDHGAWGEVASRALVADGAYIPCAEFAEVFRGVAEGWFDRGVVPVENSLEGAVTPVNDLLARTTLKVVGEVQVPVHHCLLATALTDYRDLRVAYSHPQALAQCRDFLARNRLEPRPFYDTAGAARMIARDRPRAAAAIASELAAELYGLDVIKDGIEDDGSNSTRFLLLAREPAASGDKCSVCFATAHRAGRLEAVLARFAAAGINLTRIASMPRRGDPGNYSFFLDFEGSDQDPAVAAVLADVAPLTESLAFLGCYPRSHAV